MNHDAEEQLGSYLLSRRTLLAGLGGMLGLTSAGALLAGCSIGSHSLASASVSPAVKVASSPTPVPVGTILYQYNGHSSLVLAVDWSPDGRRIVSGSFDNTAQVWDALTGKHALIYRGHSDRVNKVKWSPDGQYIASSGDGTMRVWNAITGDTLFVARDYNDPPIGIYGATWSPDSRYVASGNSSSFRVWDIMTGKTVASYDSTDGPNSPLWSPDGRYFAAWAARSPSATPFPGMKPILMLQVWDIATHNVVFSADVQISKSSVKSWSPDSQHVIFTDAMGEVKAWHIASGGKATVYPFTSNTGNSKIDQSIPEWISTGWSKSGNFVAAGNLTGFLLVWDAVTTKQAYALYNPASAIYGFAWSPDSAYIASSDGNSVSVWQAPS